MAVAGEDHLAAGFFAVVRRDFALGLDDIADLLPGPDHIRPHLGPRASTDDGGEEKNG
jgi:hypothetical protein